MRHFAASILSRDVTARPIDKAWYLLLAANDNLRLRPRADPTFYALPCDTLGDLATQLSLHARFGTRQSSQPSRG